MSKTNTQLYLDLLEKCLLDTIYGSRHIDESGKVHPIASAEQVEEGNYWPDRAHTMVGRKRLRNVRACVETILEDNIPGDLIETGVWRGGSCIFMKGILEAYGSSKKVYVADSFDGLPPPDPRYPVDADPGYDCLRSRLLAIPQEQVMANFERYDLLDDRVVFLKGWFEDTLPEANIEKLALLRLDGDMYSSTIHVLQNLYEKVSPGGFIIVDDYGIPACRDAVTDFRNACGIRDYISQIDGTGAWWRRSDGW